MDSSKDIRQERLTFYEADMSRIGEVIKELLANARAQSAMLVDKDGHMITKHGAADGFDPETVSALVAGSFAATRQVAGMLGEDEFSAIFHQGKRGSIQISIVGERAILAVVFNDDTTVGMVRLYADQAVKRLVAIFEKPSGAAGEGGSDQIDEGFHKDAQGKVDDMFEESE